MNAVPALDSYLLDLLSGDAASTPPTTPRDEAHAAEAADSASTADVVATEAGSQHGGTAPEVAGPVDPPFVYADHVPAVADVPKPYGSDVDNIALLAAESMSEAGHTSVGGADLTSVCSQPAPNVGGASAPNVGGASAPKIEADESHTPVTDTNATISIASDLLAEFDSEFPDQAIAAAVTDTSADLLAEFDSEFPDQAAAANVAIDIAADLLAEFDSEFPDQAAADAGAIDTLSDLLAEFDSEFPDQAVAASAALDIAADLLAEFDAEFPAEGAAVAATPASGCEFSAAVAEETEADEIQSRMPSAPIRVDAPPAPARVPRNLVPPTGDLPAYAKPVFDLLQRQTQDQAAQSPHGNDRRRASDRASRWLRMRCDDQHYALELLKVQEVVLPATLLPLRGAARHMLGVMNLRGQVVPVLDLGLYLDRAAIVDDTLTRIVVLEEQGEILGLRVSAVEDVTTLTDGQIEPPDNTRMCRITHPLFRGVARLAGQQTVILLDASELLR